MLASASCGLRRRSRRVVQRRSRRPADQAGDEDQRPARGDAVGIALGPRPARGGALRSSCGCPSRCPGRCALSRSRAMTSFCTFGRAFVDAQRADLAIEALDRHAALTPRPPNICTALSITCCALSVAWSLASAASRLLRWPFDVAQPGGAVDEQRGRHRRRAPSRRASPGRSALSAERAPAELAGDRARASPRRARGGRSRARRRRPWCGRRRASPSPGAKPRPRSPSRAAAGRRMSVKRQRGQRVRRDHLDALAARRGRACRRRR